MYEKAMSDEAFGEWQSKFTFSASRMRLANRKKGRRIDFDMIMKDFVDHNKIKLPSSESQCV